MAGAYFVGSGYIVRFLLSITTPLIALPTAILAKLVVAAMTVAFLLVLTGLQHFDGLIDLGNAFGVRNLHDRKMVAHAWTVTYWGALLALIVEFVAFMGLFLINPLYAFGAIVAAEAVGETCDGNHSLDWKTHPQRLRLDFPSKSQKQTKHSRLCLLSSNRYPFFAYGQSDLWA